MEVNAWRRTFIILWAGQAVSLLTSSILQMSIVWHITRETQSAAILSLATLCGYLPQAVLGPFIGALIDRYNRKTVMLLADTSIALVGLLLAAAGAVGDIPLWLIFVALFLRSIGSAFHYPSLQAVTPTIVPGDKLTKYAGYARSFESLSMIISPALAAILYSIWPLETIILLDVGGAIFAVGILFFVRLPHQERVVKKLSVRHVWAEVKEGLHVLRGKDGLLTLMVIGALYAVIYFPIGTFYPLITLTHFGGSIGDSGLVETLYSIGMLAGSFLLGIIGGKLNKLGAIAGSIGLYGICLLISGLLPPYALYVFAVLTVIKGITSPFFFGVETAIYQSQIEEQYLGRVLSLSSSISMVAMPVGMLLAGSLTEIIGVNIWFAISGVMAIILSLVAVSIHSLRRCCK